MPPRLSLQHIFQKVIKKNIVNGATLLNQKFSYTVVFIYLIWIYLVNLLVFSKFLYFLSVTVIFLHSMFVFTLQWHCL